MAVRVRIDRSILIKFFISFKLSVRDKVGIGLMKIHFVCWLYFEDPRFWGKCCWHLEPSKSAFRRVEISQFGDVHCRLHIYPKNLTFTPVKHAWDYFTNMVEKIEIVQTCWNGRVSSWPVLTVSAGSGSSGNTKTKVSQNSDSLWQSLVFSKENYDSAIN